MSGFQIPRAPGRDNRLRDVTDPFVELQVQGVRDDCTTRRTRIVRDNGLHPGTALTKCLFLAFSAQLKLCYSYLYKYELRISISLRSYSCVAVWNERFTVSIAAPELAFVRFVVFDKEGRFIVQYAMRVTRLRHGLRSVPLLHPNGQRDPHARLFVQVEQLT